MALRFVNGEIADWHALISIPDFEHIQVIMSVEL